MNRLQLDRWLIAVAVALLLTVALFAEDTVILTECDRCRLMDPNSLAGMFCRWLHDCGSGGW